MKKNTKESANDVSEYRPSRAPGSKGGNKRPGKDRRKKMQNHNKKKKRGWRGEMNTYIISEQDASRLREGCWPAEVYRRSRGFPEEVSSKFHLMQILIRIRILRKYM